MPKRTTPQQQQQKPCSHPSKIQCHARRQQQQLADKPQGAREIRKTTMAALEPRAESDGGRGGDDDDGDGVHAHSLALSVLHDLLGAAAFLASHPLHATYALFFSRHLLSLASFFCPLLVSTSLLLVVLVTVAPYATPGWPGPGARSLGRTCGIAVGALCAELRPDCGAGGGVALVGQLCSFVLGPADGDAVLRVGEIMGELCDITGSCFLLEEKSSLSATEECDKLAAELPLLQSLTGEKIFLDHEKFDEIKDEIEEKNVVSEDLMKELKGPPSFSELYYPSEAFVQEMDEQGGSIKEQTLSLSGTDGVSDGVGQKRLECEHVTMDIKKCELVKSHSSISPRIMQWEAQVCVNLKQVRKETEDNSVASSLEKGLCKDVKQSMELETEACTENLQAQEIASVELSVQEQQEQEFKDVEELVQLGSETSTRKCNQDLEAEESAAIAQADQDSQEQSHKDVQPEPELLEPEYKVVQPEQELQEQDYDGVQPEPEYHENEYNDANEGSEVLCDGARENPLKSTSIAGRVHSRTSSENLVSREGSPALREEWKRTLACKLYEERIQLKLCRDRAIVGCSDDMDMLWEACEAGGGGGSSSSASATGDMKRGRNLNKARGAAADTQGEEFVEESKLEDDEDDDDEDPVRPLCCLQALKFSTRKMNFGGGKPSLAKISKVLKRMTAVSRVGSRRNLQKR